MQEQNWPPAVRLVWLEGGLIATNQPSSKDVEVRTHVLGKIIGQYSIHAYHDLLPSLFNQGFRVIGVTFVTSADQAKGLQAPEFRMLGLAIKWPIWDSFQAWRQIAARSAHSEEMPLMDIASRIATGLEYSEMRICDLAQSYNDQLHAYLGNHDDSAKEYQAFKDTLSPYVYKSIHALFWEMAVLRDVLAEFFARFCLKRDKITTFASLQKSIKKQPSLHPMEQEWSSAAGQEAQGWLGQFGSYRNAFTHSAPMENISGLAFAVQDQLTLKGSQAKLPRMYFPLPQDPEELMRKRSKGVLFSTYKEMARASNVKHDRAVEPDAMAYLHGVLVKMGDLAAGLVKYSPLEPTPIIISKEDIIGDVQVRRA